VSGTTVSDEREHLLEVEAADRAGNHSEVSVRFTIDKTPPTVVVSGVDDGAIYEDAVTPVIEALDLHLSDVVAHLNGASFLSGTEVSASGSYHLVVSATDRAGNRTESSTSFVIRSGAHNVELQLSKRDASAVPARVLALVRSGVCAPPEGEVERIEQFLRSRLNPAPWLLEVTESELEFLSALRSGRHTAYLLFSVEDERCHGCAPSAPWIRDAIARELTERGYSGRGGVVFVRLRPENLPAYRELLGLDLRGRTSATRVELELEPLGPAELALNGRAVRLALNGATAVGRYSDERCHPHGEVAVGMHSLGRGRAVTFGFDPTRASPENQAGEVLGRALAFVSPDSLDPGPLGWAAVEITVANAGDPVTIRVRESLQTPLQAGFAWPIPVAATDSVIEWEQTLATSDVADHYLLVKLPNQAGAFATTTEVFALLDAEPELVATQSLQLSVASTGMELLAEARAVAAVLPAKGHDGAIRKQLERLLDKVEERPVRDRKDVEANLDDLLAAVDEAKRLKSVSPLAMRLTLDELIRYWEAQWLAY